MHDETENERLSRQRREAGERARRQQERQMEEEKDAPTAAADAGPPPTANEQLILQLRALRAIALSRERELLAKSSEGLTCYAKTLLHGQVEYIAGKVQALDDAIGLVEAAERAVISA